MLTCYEFYVICALTPDYLIFRLEHNAEVDEYFEPIGEYYQNTYITFYSIQITLLKKLYFS